MQALFCCVHTVGGGLVAADGVVVDGPFGVREGCDILYELVELIFCTVTVSDQPSLVEPNLDCWYLLGTREHVSWLLVWRRRSMGCIIFWNDSNRSGYLFKNI